MRLVVPLLPLSNLCFQPVPWWGRGYTYREVTAKLEGWFWCAFQTFWGGGGGGGHGEHTLVWNGGM